jgi:hypothetical protein
VDRKEQTPLIRFPKSGADQRKQLSTGLRPQLSDVSTFSGPDTEKIPTTEVKSLPSAGVRKGPLKRRVFLFLIVLVVLTILVALGIAIGLHTGLTP